MPWCPKCKNEYIEGILQCAECKVPLVESLEEVGGSDEPEGYEEKERELLTEEENLEELLEGEEEEQTQEESPKERVHYHAYQNSADKAEDNRSSAYTLLLVGGVGLLVDVLVMMGVIPVYVNGGISKYLVCGVMGAMFVLFLVFGGVSMKSSRILMVKAKSEDSLLSEITRWCEENLTAAKIDDQIGEQEVPEEQKYFSRVEKMKELIGDKFLNLDEAFLDHFVDDYYRKLFENE